MLAKRRAKVVLGARRLDHGHARVMVLVRRSSLLPEMPDAFDRAPLR